MTENKINHLGTDLHWVSPAEAPKLEALLNNWLTDTGSLTERLQANCRQFQVKLLAQGVSDIFPNEAQLLYGKVKVPVETTEVREVLLMADDTPWVFARSLMPQSFLREKMRDLQHIGEQPLGKIIFNDPRFERQKFQLTQMPSSMLPSEWRAEREMTLWGRRSLFTFEDTQMMVAEIFLPDSPAYSRYSG